MALSGKSKNQGSGVSPPAAPKPQNEYVYSGDTLVSQREYDKSKNGYVSKTFLTPDEQAIETQSTGILKNLVGRLPQYTDMSPEALQRGVDAYTQPQFAALDESYNRALGQAKNQAVGQGVSNSVGFNDYLAREIERNRAQGRADIAAGGEMYRYQLPTLALQPFQAASALLSGNNTNINNQEAQALQAAYQGSVAGSNNTNSAYQNQLAAYNNSLFGKLRQSASNSIFGF